MKKRVLKVLGLVMIMMLVITSLPIQGVAFATDTNSLKLSTVVSLEKVEMKKEENVAFLPPLRQEDIVLGDGTGFEVKINVPSRASLSLSFPNNESSTVTVIGGDNFNLTAPIGTKLLLTYTDEDDNGQVFENVKVAYEGVNGTHVLGGPLLLVIGIPFEQEHSNTVIDYVTSWKGEAENDDEVPEVFIDPASKTFNMPFEVTLTSDDVGATIYYKLDEGGYMEYSVPFEVDSTVKVTAYAKDMYMNESSEKSETYTLDKDTFVTIMPESMDFNGTISVSIDSETDAIVYFTTNDGEPTESSLVYSGPFTISETTTVKALAVDLAGNQAMDEKTYTLDESMPSISIIPTSQDFDNPLTVNITSEGENPIYFTLDGNEPDSGSTPYTGPFEVSETSVVKAIAYNYLETPSQIAMETYTFKPSVFIPEEGSESIEATNIILRYGYNRTPEEGYKDLNAIITPKDLDVVGDSVWTISNGGNIIDLVSNRVSYENSGIAEVLVTVLYYENEILKSITDTLKVTVEYYPAPTPPTTSTPTPRISIALDKDPVELEYGTEASSELLSYDLTETITGSSNENVTWTIDDDTIATVDKNGVVTAVKQGETTVTVKHNTSGKTATSDVIVFLAGDEPNPLGLVEFYDPYVFGYPDQSFRPKNSVTRAEVATMFAKILKLNIDYPGVQSFIDISPEAWYFNYVQAIQRTDIFVGDTAGNFRPDEPITRAEMATVFGKFWEYMKTPVDRKAVVIGDVDGTHWASKYIYMMYNAGIVTGFEDGTYRPNDPTLREQVVGMINTLIARPEYDAPGSRFTDINNSHWAFGNIEAASQPFVIQQNIPVVE